MPLLKCPEDPHHNLLKIFEEIHGVWFESTFKGKKRKGHLRIINTENLTSIMKIEKTLVVSEERLTKKIEFSRSKVNIFAGD